MSGEDHRAVRTSLKTFNEVTHKLAELMMDSAVQVALKHKKVSEV